MNFRDVKETELINLMVNYIESQREKEGSSLTPDYWLWQLEGLFGGIDY